MSSSRRWLLLSCLAVSGFLRRTSESSQLRAAWVTAPRQGVRRRQGQLVAAAAGQAESSSSNDLERAQAEAEAAKLRLEVERLRAEVAEAKQEQTTASSNDSSVAAAASADAAVPSAVPESSASAADAEIGTEARSLAESKVLQSAARCLLRLRGSSGGRERFETLIERACSSLEAGGNSGSIGAACSDILAGYDAVAAEKAWQEAGLSLQEAKSTLKAAAMLLAPGDKAFATTADRKAALQVLSYDQLPDQYESFGAVFDAEGMQSEEVVSETDRGFTFMDPAVLEGVGDEERAAARFSNRLELLSSEDEKLRSRLQRLREMPLVRDSLKLAAANDDFAELGQALQPYELKVYGAVRKAQGRLMPKDGRQVVKIEFNFLQVVGALVLVVALGFFTAQGIKSNLASSSQQMPLYGLEANGGQRQ